MRKSEKIIIEKRKVEKMRQNIRAEMENQRDKIATDMTKLKQGKLAPEVLYRNMFGENAIEKINKMK